MRVRRSRWAQSGAALALCCSCWSAAAAGHAAVDADADALAALLAAAPQQTSLSLSWRGDKHRQGSGAPDRPDDSLSSTSSLQRPLYGRFLHITDMHPDSFYKHGSAVLSGCHSDKPHKKKDGGARRAGFWGTGVSECDAPPRLVSATLDWVAENWLSSGDSEERNGFDYILWTGDSARHDIDSAYPRTRTEIFDYNRWSLGELEKRFPGVPIVPSIGNNDIFPHNIMFPGPNEVTNTFASIWSSHVPESEFHVFQRGGYFAKEVLPDHLAVLSLNTLYFYDSNKAVDGCAKYKKSTPEKDRDPGSLQLDWLEVQIAQFRRRGMQVQLIGHVPPTAGNYFRRCYDRYTDIVLRYQDTVLGQHFGHMNVDAIFVQEGSGGMVTNSASAEEEAPTLRGRRERRRRHAASADVPLHIAAAEDIVDDIRDEFDTLPGRKRTNLDHYNFYYLAPSVIPTWWPSVRIWTYNTSMDSAYTPKISTVEEVRPNGLLLEDEEEEPDEEPQASCADTCGSAVFCAERSHRRPSPGRHRKGKKGKKHKRPPMHSSERSPTRTNRFLTPLGYSQWILNIDKANADYERAQKDSKHHKRGRWQNLVFPAPRVDEERHEAQKRPLPKLHFHLEYATYTPRTLWSEFLADDSARSTVPPVPRALLEAELQRFGITVPRNSTTALLLDDAPRAQRASGGKKQKLPKQLRQMTDWRLDAMTIDQVMDMARRLANDRKLWKRYVQRIFTSSPRKDAGKKEL